MGMTSALCSIGALLISASAFAQSPSDQIDQRVKDGQRVSITVVHGREFSGRVAEKSIGGLTVVDGDQRAKIPYDQITSIDQPKDRLWNGAIYGLAIGAGLGLLAGDDGSDDPYCGFGFFDQCSDTRGSAAVVGGLVGLALGAGVDALIHRDRNIYRRPGISRISLAPTYGRRGSGLLVSLAW
jgi:hypothetical protein